MPLVADAMSEWKIPAWGLPSCSTVALLKAYGCRDVEAGLLVTIDTGHQCCAHLAIFRLTICAIVSECVMIVIICPIELLGS